MCHRLISPWAGAALAEVAGRGQGQEPLPALESPSCSSRPGLASHACPAWLLSAGSYGRRMPLVTQGGRRRIDTNRPLEAPPPCPHHRHPSGASGKPGREGEAALPPRGTAKADPSRTWSASGQRTGNACSSTRLLRTVLHAGHSQHGRPGGLNTARLGKSPSFGSPPWQ